MYNIKLFVGIFGFIYETQVFVDVNRHVMKVTLKVMKKHKMIFHYTKSSFRSY